jgi:hypothetical protein
MLTIAKSLALFPERRDGAMGRAFSYAAALGAQGSAWLIPPPFLSLRAEALGGPGLKASLRLFRPATCRVRSHSAPSSFLELK